MNRISKLKYRLMTSDNVEFRDPEPVPFTRDGATFHLAEETVTCDLHVAFFDEASARAHVEPILKDWEVYWGLRSNRQFVRFRFSSATREPSIHYDKRGHKVITASASDTVYTTSSVSAKVALKEYELPHSRFHATPVVEAMWLLYERYQKGRERLLPMAYSVYTLFETSGGGNLKDCARYYHVSRKVLEQLKAFSSFGGDLTEARKFTGSSSNRPLTNTETRWIGAVVKELILRAGEHAADPDSDLPMITKDDFPKMDVD